MKTVGVKTAALTSAHGDGTLTAADAGYAPFRVLVTNADGAKTARTLTDLGITEINLTEDSTRIVLPDGSVIEGQTTFTKSDGSTGTVASTALVAAAEGYRVDFWMVQAEARAAMGWM